MDLKSILSAAKKDSITIFIFRGANEIKKIYLRSFALKLLGFTTIFLLLCFMVLIISTIYLGKSNESLKQRVASLELAASRIKIAQETKKTEREKALKETTKKSIPFKPSSETQKIPISEFTSDSLDIVDLSIIPDDTTPLIRISFLLNNTRRDRIISGYVTILGFSKDFDTSLYSSYPATIKLNDDYNPANYRYGERFSINRFRSIEATLANFSQDRKIRFIVITAYSMIGELILRKITEL
ncbi:MAG: hypothetical protein JSV96_16735 [Candidatus Aminicenantes bacterium]|nr:MAG: hypothetical protein JSV96_16735 [Candidatus Aminicenantes bacterium]